MFRTVFYTFQHTIQPTVVGGNVDSDSFPWSIKTTYDQIIGISVFSTPIPIFVALQEEGVDFPLFSRFETARNFSKPRQPITEGLGYSAPLALLAIIDETALSASKVWELPNYDIKNNRRKVSYLKLVESQTFNIAPATTYQDNACRVLSEIQRHMLEGTVDDGKTWDLWTQQEVLDLLNARMAKFFLDTGIIYERETETVVSGTENFDLPSDLVLLRRVAWDTGSLVGKMDKIDTFQMDNTSIGWEALSGTPTLYVEEPRDPLSARLSPTPSADGTIDLLYVPAPETIPLNTCSILETPAAFSFAIKYGVMADMFRKEGEASDLQRAQYCEKRYQEGVELAKMLMGLGG